MNARQSRFESDLFGADISKAVADHRPNGKSDSAGFDNALELLVQSAATRCPCDDDADPRGRGPAIR